MWSEQEVEAAFRVWDEADYTPEELELCRKGEDMLAAYKAGAAFGRDKGLTEAASKFESWGFNTEVYAHDVAKIIRALMTTTPQQVEGEVPDSDEMARRGAK